MIRMIPENLNEMLEWGIISHWVFNKVSHLSFEDAKKEISEYYGTQTWSVQPSQIHEYIEKYSINVNDYTAKQWMVHCLTLTKGRMNPNTAFDVYNSLVKK